MSNINKIRLSGTTYDIEDLNAAKTVELTQAQYDALTVKDPNTFYVITDAQAADLSSYYTKSEVDTKLGAKQATLVSGTNIKTINNESILGEGNIEIQGGSSINVVQTTGTSTTDVMSQDAVIKALPTYIVSNVSYDTTDKQIKIARSPRGSSGGWVNVINVSTINNQHILGNNANFSLVETSAITTSVTSASTDSQVPSAKAVYDALQESGGGTVDTELDSTSENPVQNKVIYQKFDEVEEVTAAALNDLNDKIGDINTLLEGI